MSRNFPKHCGRPSKGVGNIKENRGKGIPFLITISFLLSFLFIRLIVLLVGSAESEFARVAKHGLRPEVDFYIGRNIILFGYHIHHFYFGILLICVAGWVAIVGSPTLKKKHAAIIYGTGLGLFMDEIGLLLTWGDYYSSLTYLLTILLVAVFLNVVFFPYFWEEVRTSIAQRGASSTIWYSLFGLKNFLKVADYVSTKTGKTERAALIFTGIVFISAGILILRFPQFVYYWVAGGFIVQGVASLFRAWQQEKEEKEETGTEAGS